MCNSEPHKAIFSRPSAASSHGLHRAHSGSSLVLNSFLKNIDNKEAVHAIPMGH